MLHFTRNCENIWRVSLFEWNRSTLNFMQTRKKLRRWADLNHWPFDLQSNALPLSYISMWLLVGHWTLGNQQTLLSTLSKTGTELTSHWKWFHQIISIFQRSSNKTLFIFTQIQLINCCFFISHFFVEIFLLNMCSIKREYGIWL